MLPDGELLRRFVENQNEEAFAEVVRRHINLVYSAALRTLNGDEHRANDVTQLVFAKLAVNAHSLRRRETLIGWLYTTAHNMACKAIRSEIRRRHWEKEANAMQETLAATVPEPPWDRLGPILEGAMHELRVGDREVLLLRFFESRPFADIGRAFGIAENAARMRVDRALDKLRAVLATRGIDSTATALAAALTAQSSLAAPATLAATATAAAVIAAQTATGGMAISLFSIMASAKITVTAGLLAVAAVTVAVRQAVQAHRAEDMLTSATADLSQAKMQVRDLEIDLNQARERVTAMSNAPVSATPSTFDVRAYEQEKARRLAEEAKARAAVQEKIALSPDVQKLRFDAFRANIHLRYGALHKALRLSPDDIVRFGKILEEKFWAISDVTASARTQNIARSDPAFQSMKEAALAPVDARFKSLLGEDGFSRLRNYEAAGDVHDLVEGIYGKVALASTPLSPEQSLEVMKIFAQNRLAAPHGSSTWLENQIIGRSPRASIDLGDIHWDNVLPQLRALLSPDQLAALNVIYLQTALAGRADRMVERRQREASGKQ